MNVSVGCIVGHGDLDPTNRNFMCFPVLREALEGAVVARVDGGRRNALTTLPCAVCRMSFWSCFASSSTPVARLTGRNDEAEAFWLCRAWKLRTTASIKTDDVAYRLLRTVLSRAPPLRGPLLVLAGGGALLVA